MIGKKHLSELFFGVYHFVRACFSGMGLLFLPIEIYTNIANSPSPLDLTGFIIWGVALGLGVYLIDGEFITGFARKQISWRVPSTNTTIEIIFGDLFEEENPIAIGVNDRFDYVVDDKIIAKSSLHGQAILKHWPEPSEWKEAIDKELLRKAGRIDSYQPIGRCVNLERNGKHFLFFVVSETDEKTNVTSSNSEKVVVAVKGMLDVARIVGAGRPLSIPLVGAGLARVGLHSDGILHIILAALTEACKSSHVTSKIRIVLRPGTEHEINLLQIMRTWS